MAEGKMRWYLLAGATAMVAVLAAEPAAAQRAFFTNAFSAAVPIPADPEFAEVQSLELRRGSYLASAVVVLASNDPEFHLVDCALAVDGGIIAPVSSGAIGGQPNNFLTLPLLLGVKLENQEQTLSVVCRTNVDNIVVSQPTSLAALRVGSIQ
jgi:hypothetical protein